MSCPFNHSSASLLPDLSGAYVWPSVFLELCLAPSLWCASAHRRVSGPVTPVQTRFVASSSFTPSSNCPSCPCVFLYPLEYDPSEAKFLLSQIYPPCSMFSLHSLRLSDEMCFKIFSWWLIVVRVVVLLEAAVSVTRTIGTIATFPAVPSGQIFFWKKLCKGWVKYRAAQACKGQSSLSCLSFNPTLS